MILMTLLHADNNPLRWGHEDIGEGGLGGWAEDGDSGQGTGQQSHMSHLNGLGIF